MVFFQQLEYVFPCVPSGFAAFTNSLNSGIDTLIGFAGGTGGIDAHLLSDSSGEATEGLSAFGLGIPFTRDAVGVR